MKCFGIVRIFPSKDTPDRFISLHSSDFFQFFSPCSIGRDVRETPLIDETIDIESGSPTDDRKFTSFPYILEDWMSHVSVFYYGKIPIRSDDIEHIVRNASHFFLRDFPRSDIKTAVDLSRVRRNNLTSDCASYIDRKSSFS